MPIDPSISLGINVPTPVNPMDSLNSLMSLSQKSSEISGINALTQSHRLENIKTQREISAQNALAGLAQQATDPSTGAMDPAKFFQLGMTNPYTAAMMPQLAQQLRLAQQTQQEIASKRQDMARVAFGDILGDVAGTASTPNPESAVGLINSRLASYSPQTQQDLGPFIKHIQQSVYSDLPSDPIQRAETIKSRVLPIAARILTPEQLQQYTGKPENIETKDGFFPGKRDVFTNQLTATGPKVFYGMPPQLTTPDTFAQPGIHPTQNLFPTNSTNGLFQGAVAQAPFAPSATPRFTGTGAIGSGPSPPAPSRPTYIGVPLAAGLRTDPSITAVSVAGNPIQSPGDRETNEKIASYMGEAGSREYNNAQTTQTLLADMHASFARLGPDGFLAPGAAAEDRAKFGNIVNTVLTAFTGPDSKWQQSLEFDPTKIASMQDIGKSSRRLAISYLTTALGVQREAAQTIQSIQQAVPNLENSPLGAQLLMNNIEALNQRQIDRYEFMRDWGNKNHGVFNNAETAFNSTHPAEAYGEAAFEKVGLSPGKGWMSIDALGNALRQGWITPAQFKAMGKAQFGDDAGKAHVEALRAPTSTPSQISNPLMNPSPAQ